MTEHRAYYSIIQYCPDLGRLESANIGVVLFCPALHYLDTQIAQANDRIIHFFGRKGHDWNQINSFKNGIKDRIRHSTMDIRDKDSFSHFINLQANLLQLTPPLPCKITSKPEKELEDLFEELVGSKKKNATGKNLRTMLGNRFDSGGISDKIKRNISVKVPVVDKQMNIPYGFKNGRFNLITSVLFGARDKDKVISTACRYAVEGEALYTNPDAGLGDMQLVVVGKFREPNSDAQNAVSRILKEHQVKLYRFDEKPQFDQVSSLIDVIQRTGKSFS